MYKNIMTAVFMLVMLMMAAGVIFMLRNPIGRNLPPVPQVENSAPAALANDSQAPAAGGAIIAEDTVCTGPDGVYMSANEAESLAATGECGQTGAVAGEARCNTYSNTWWLNLEPNEPKVGCSPACVVHVGTKAVEVNWRCTGAIPPAAPGSGASGDTGAIVATPPSPSADGGDLTCADGQGGSMSVEEARALAATGECGQTGAVAGEARCNSYTMTWWLNLEPNEPKAGCSPACVVHVGTKAIEVNWRCTGLIPPR